MLQRKQQLTLMIRIPNLKVTRSKVSREIQIQHMIVKVNQSRQENMEMMVTQILILIMTMIMDRDSLISINGRDLKTVHLQQRTIDNQEYL